jgi:hypothetical protein
VFQPSRDFRFLEELSAALGVAGVLLLNLLEGDLAPQLGVLGHEDLTQAAPGVGAEDAVARPGARTVVVGGATVWGGQRFRVSRPVERKGDFPQRAVWVLQLARQRRRQRHRGQAPGWVVAVGLEVLGDEGLQQGEPAWIESTLRDQDLAERAALLPPPDAHGGAQGVRSDEVHLQGQEAELQVAVGVGVRHGRSPKLPELPGPRRCGQAQG